MDGKGHTAIMQVMSFCSSRHIIARCSRASLLLVCLQYCAVAQAKENCAVSASAKGYSVCLPKGWWYFVDAGNRTLACNQPGECSATGGGFPRKGKVMLAIIPATALRWDPRNSNLTSFVREHERKCDSHETLRVSSGSDPGSAEIQRWNCPYTGGFPGTLTYGVRLKDQLFLVNVEYDPKSHGDELGSLTADIVRSMRLTNDPPPANNGNSRPTPK